MKKFDLVIKNGTVVTASDMFSADLGVKDGKIAAIAENIEADADEVFDAAGKLVLPGALDVHTHLAVRRYDFFRQLSFRNQGRCLRRSHNGL